jgi:hypothetical protein
MSNIAEQINILIEVQSVEGRFFKPDGSSRIA